MTAAPLTPADVMPGGPPLVLVTVGTTHHTMDRLMGWVERWIADNPGRARVIVQHGSSRLPEGADGFSLCSPDEAAEWNTRSQVVVTQGGPGGIMDSRYSGILPIAVPRRPDLNEVVDDHQLRFCRSMADAGLIRMATDEDGFRTELDAALADPDALRITVDHESIAAAVERTGMLIEDLVRRKPSRFARRHGRR